MGVIGADPWGVVGEASEATGAVIYKMLELGFQGVDGSLSNVKRSGESEGQRAFI